MAENNDNTSSVHSVGTNVNDPLLGNNASSSSSSSSSSSNSNTDSNAGSSGNNNSNAGSNAGNVNELFSAADGPFLDLIDNDDNIRDPMSKAVAKDILDYSTDYTMTYAYAPSDTQLDTINLAGANMKDGTPDPTPGTPNAANSANATRKRDIIAQLAGIVVAIKKPNGNTLIELTVGDCLGIYPSRSSTDPAASEDIYDAQIIRFGPDNGDSVSAEAITGSDCTQIHIRKLGAGGVFEEKIIYKDAAAAGATGGLTLDKIGYVKQCADTNEFKPRRQMEACDNSQLMGPMGMPGQNGPIVVDIETIKDDMLTWKKNNWIKFFKSINVDCAEIREDTYNNELADMPAMAPAAEAAAERAAKAAAQEAVNNILPPTGTHTDVLNAVLIAAAAPAAGNTDPIVPATGADADQLKEAIDAWYEKEEGAKYAILDAYNYAKEAAAAAADAEEEEEGTGAPAPPLPPPAPPTPTGGHIGLDIATQTLNTSDASVWTEPMWTAFFNAIVPEDKKFPAEIRNRMISTARADALRLAAHAIPASNTNITNKTESINNIATWASEHLTVEEFTAAVAAANAANAAAAAPVTGGGRRKHTRQMRKVKTRKARKTRKGHVVRKPMKKTTRRKNNKASKSRKNRK